jgi:ribosomal protein S6--L-glutamate ligase
MNFLILTRLPELYSIQRLVQEVAARGHQALTMNPEAADLELGWARCQVVIPRIGNFRYAEAMVRFEQMARKFPHVRILNGPEAFHRARHKLQAHAAFGDLPQPRLYTGPHDPDLAFPLVVKDCVSSQGDGVFLCRDEVELERCLHKLQGREILLQEFIHESSGRDVRAFVVGTKIVAAIERTAADPVAEFRANLSLGGSAKAATLSTAETEICLLAVRRLMLNCAGVDFIRSRRGPLLLEANPSPGLEGIESFGAEDRVNVAKEMVLYAESLFDSDP